MLCELVTVFISVVTLESFYSAKIPSCVTAKSDIQRICAAGVHDEAI